jgi:hypothetical protein
MRTAARWICLTLDQTDRQELLAAQVQLVRRAAQGLRDPLEALAQQDRQEQLGAPGAQEQEARWGLQDQVVLVERWE